MSESIAWMCLRWLFTDSTMGNHQETLSNQPFERDVLSYFFQAFFFTCKIQGEADNEWKSIAKSMVGRRFFFWGVTYFEGRSLLVSKRVASKSWLEVHDGTGRRFFFVWCCLVVTVSGPNVLINFKGVLLGDIMTSINNSPPTFIPKERSSKRKHLKWTHLDAGALCVRKWRPLLGELLSVRGELEKSGSFGIKKLCGLQHLTDSLWGEDSYGWL